jgi:hypothetical protein
MIDLVTTPFVACDKNRCQTWSKPAYHSIYIEMYINFVKNNVLWVCACRNMVGIEYVVLLAQEPDLYVVRKQKRLSPKLTEHMESYYVLQGTIFKSPTIGDVVASRTVNIDADILRAAASLNIQQRTQT